MKRCPFFATAQNFLDPQFTKDGKPYGPVRYRELVKECYIISKNCNTPYTDVLKMSSKERQYFLSFLAEEFKRIEQQSKEQRDKLKELLNK